MDYTKIEVIRVAAIYISLLFAVVDTKETISFLPNPHHVVVHSARRVVASAPDNGHRPSSYLGEPDQDIDLDEQVTQLQVNDNQQQLFNQVNVLLTSMQARIDMQLSLTHDHLSDIKDALKKLHELVVYNGQVMERGQSDAVVHYKNTHAVAQTHITLLTALQKKLEDQIAYQKESLEYQKKSIDQVNEVKDLLVPLKGALTDIVDLIKQQQEERKALVERVEEPMKNVSFFAQLDGYQPYVVSVVTGVMVGLKMSVSAYLYACLNDRQSWSFFSTKNFDAKTLAQILYDAACKKYAGTLDNFSQGTIKARFLIDIEKELHSLHTWQAWYDRFGLVARLCMPACLHCNERIQRLYYYKDICIQEWKNL